MLLIALFSLLLACSQPAEEDTDRPNILLIMTDDQSWLHTSYAGDPVANTPTFDRLAREGAYFEQAYVSAPTCTASRSALLSGQHLWRLGGAGVLWGELDDKMLSFQRLLQQEGYHTGVTGKGWGPGYSEVPHHSGVPYNSIQVEGDIRGVSSIDYAANFSAFLDSRPAGAPFSFWFSPYEPHRPYDRGVGLRSGIDAADVPVPPFLPDNEVIRRDLADYYYEIEWQDRALAQMLDELEQRGLLDNTLIIATSDNGMPFPRAKATNYDTGVRVPLAVRWGRQIPAQDDRIEVISITDLAPTLLAAAGVQVPGQMTGRNLLPLLVPERAELEPAADFDYALSGFERHVYNARPDGTTYPVRAIHTRDFVYVRNFAPERWPVGNPPHYRDIDSTSPSRSNVLQNPEFLELATQKRPAEELYHLPSDPWQLENLADNPEYALVKQALSDRLEKALLSSDDPQIRGDLDHFAEFSYHGQVQETDQLLLD